MIYKILCLQSEKIALTSKKAYQASELHNLQGYNKGIKRTHIKAAT